MKEIIWIAGASAVGKKTFINKLVQERSFRERFELLDSIVNIDCKAGDFTATRDKISNSRADHVLLKWQHRDRDGIEILENLYPEARHRMFILWCSRARHFQRYIKKHTDTIRKKLEREPTHSELIESFNRDRKENNKWLQKFLSRTGTCSKTIEVKIIDSGQAGYPALENIPSD